MPPKTTEEHSAITHNFAFAAFLILKGYRLLKPPFLKLNQYGNEGYAFLLNVKFDDLRDLYAEYQASDAKKYDSISLELRKLTGNLEAQRQARKNEVDQVRTRL